MHVGLPCDPFYAGKIFIAATVRSSRSLSPYCFTVSASIHRASLRAEMPASSAGARSSEAAHAAKCRRCRDLRRRHRPLGRPHFQGWRGPPLGRPHNPPSDAISTMSPGRSCKATCVSRISGMIPIGSAACSNILTLPSRSTNEEAAPIL